MTKITDIPAIRFKGFSDTWEQRKVGDVTKELSEYDNLASGLPLLTSSRNGLMYQSDYRGNVTTENENTLFSVVPINACTYRHMSDDSTFHLNINTLEKGLVSREYPVFQEDGSNLKFIVQYINSSNSFTKFCTKQKKGGTRTRLYYKTLCEYTLMITSIKEQNKIAEFFESLDYLITLHQRKYDKLTNVKKSMLEKMFPQNGSNVPEIRFKGFTEAWEQRKVREVTDRYDNLRIPVAASLRVAGTTPYYGANGIQDYVDGYTHDGEFILVAEDGANDLKNYPVKCVKGRIWVNNHAHVLQGKYDCADNQFLAYAISQADIESLLVGGGRAKLNAETLMGIDLLLPNKAEQIRIGKYLAQLDNLITLHQRELEKLKNLKKACLEKMFV